MASKEKKAGKPAVTVKSTMDHQEDGNHYKKLKIQPTTIAKANNLDCYQFSVIKHVMRHNLKGEGIEDLKKTVHYALMALEEDYGIVGHTTYVDTRTPPKAPVKKRRKAGR